MNRNKKMIFSTVALLALAACGSSKMKGTYSNESKAALVVLDLRSSEKASLTIEGMSQVCTYQVDGKKLHLTCSNGVVTYEFNILDDGSLTGDGVAGYLGVLRKSKS